MNALSRLLTNRRLIGACCCTVAIAAYTQMLVAGAALWPKLTALVCLALSSILVWYSRSPKRIESSPMKERPSAPYFGLRGKTDDSIPLTTSLPNGLRLSATPWWTLPPCDRSIDDSPSTISKGPTSNGGGSTSSSTTGDSDSTLSWLRQPWISSAGPSDEMTSELQKQPRGQLLPLHSAPNCSIISISDTEQDSKTSERRQSETCSTVTHSSQDCVYFLRSDLMRLRHLVRNIAKDSSFLVPAGASVMHINIAALVELVETRIKDSNLGT